VRPPRRTCYHVAANVSTSRPPYESRDHSPGWRSAAVSARLALFHRCPVEPSRRTPTIQTALTRRTWTSQCSPLCHKERSKGAYHAAVVRATHMLPSSPSARRHIEIRISRALTGRHQAEACTGLADTQKVDTRNEHLASEQLSRAMPSGSVDATRRSTAAEVSCLDAFAAQLQYELKYSKSPAISLLC